MKKTFTSKALIVTFKKTQDFLPFFKTLSLFSRLFPSVGNVGQISRLFQEFKTLDEPGIHTFPKV